MIFPEGLKKGDSLGVTAISDGVSDPLDKIRFENGRKKLKEQSIDVIFTDDVFNVTDLGRSAEAKIRAKEFNDLLADDKVKAIVSAKGGNFLNEMMEYVDFERIKKNPKWFQGFSDNTWMVHTLTTKYDIASIYGNNFGEFGMDIWHRNVSDHFEILKGNFVTQKSFIKYQNGFADRITGLEGYNEDKDVFWKLDSKISKKSDKVSFGGRLIGGCLDVLLYIQGTKYDYTLEFLEKYKEDGIIWYIESFDITAENLMMFLWKLKEIGWFKYTKGILFGRPLFYRESMGIDYEAAVLYALGSLDIPIVFDCDFGHLAPRFSMVNGAVAKVSVEYGKGKLEYVY